MDPDTYCREIESYLCRKNDGHLVRVVGPAFAVVSGWVARAIPLKVACRGIDRYFERYYAKGPRRRPVRIEFCEADVLDVFDEWRRAVGVGTAGDGAGTAGLQATAEEPEPAHKHGQSLRSHLDRVVTRLTDVQARGGDPGLVAAVDRLIDELGGARSASRSLRGEAREAYIRRLDRLDEEMIEAARAATPPDALRVQADGAAEELSGFRDRMPPEAYERALRAAADRLLREYWKLPTVAYRQG